MKTSFTFRGGPRQTPQAGQAIVEFMLVTVFLLVLFVSVLQMILLMHAYNTLADAAKEGIRYQIVHGTGNSNCSGPSKTGTSNVIVDYNPNSANVGGACNRPGCLVRVTVRHTYQPFFGLGWPKFPLYAAADGRIMN